MLRPLDKKMRGVELVVGTPFLYFRDSSTLLMADLHLGFEEAASRGLYYGLRKSSGFYAVFVPRIQLKKAIDMLKFTLEYLDVKRVVVNGDLKHAFDRLLRQEKEEVVALIRFLREMGVSEILVIRGNHDNFIKPILRELDIEFVKALSTQANGHRILIVHGHEDVDLSGHDAVIIGHEHPSLRCFDVYRFPCFLKIPLSSGKTIIVIPATGPYHPGVIVNPNPSEYLSPLIRRLDSLESMQLVSWIDLGEIPARSIDYFESFTLEDYVLIEKYRAGGKEFAVVEFKNYNIARAICEI